MFQYGPVFKIRVVFVSYIHTQEALLRARYASLRFARNDKIPLYTYYLQWIVVVGTKIDRYEL